MTSIIRKITSLLALVALAALAGGPFRADASTGHPRKVTPKLERHHRVSLVQSYGMPFRTR